jgi:hypothetical protein
MRYLTDHQIEKVAEKNINEGKFTIGDFGRGALYGGISGLGVALVTTPEEVKYMNAKVDTKAEELKRITDLDPKLRKFLEPAKYTPYETFKSKAKRGVIGSAAGFGIYTGLSEGYRHWIKPRYLNEK